MFFQLTFELSIVKHSLKFNRNYKPNLKQIDGDTDSVMPLGGT